MDAATVDLALRLLTYVVILVAVPLSFVALFRLVDYLALDDVAERHADVRRDPSLAHEPERDPDDDRVRCRECGARNESTYTFCRRCQARIGM